MAIRYAENGEIETYDEKTGKTTGHISTMGNRGNRRRQGTQ